ncbi:MAG: hypothetical protein ACM3ZQ_08775 [Bacillota bacterium]
MPVSRLLIIIADRCPWHVLLVDMMSVKLREKGIACGVIGLVEQGILNAAHISGLRRLADKTGGAWDLANGQELAESVLTLGLHLYHKFGHSIATCEIVVLDHGHLTALRDCVETGIRRLTEALAQEELITDLIFQWRMIPISQMYTNTAEPRPWTPPPLDLPSEGKMNAFIGRATARTLPVQPRATGSIEANAASRIRDQKTQKNSIQKDHSSQPYRSGKASKHGWTTDRMIQWGLWLSGGALLSVLTLLAKN